LTLDAFDYRNGVIIIGVFYRLDEKSLEIVRMRLMKTMAALLLVVMMLPGLTGCWYAAAAGAGAYGGYKAKEAGYSLQSPVKKDSTGKQSGKKETKQDSTQKQ